MAKTSVIETGVDKLLALVQSKKRISMQDAAKQLGVGQQLIEEWSEFLEEEGIISIEYKFATPYLVERKLSKTEVKDKEKEFHSKKEGFVRKAEITLAVLDKEGDFFQKFKTSFEGLKKALGSELDHVESELKQLEKFEELKRGIDKQIIDQERNFRKKLDEFESEIKKEQQKYQHIIDSLKQEEEKLDRDRIETISLREREMGIRKKLEQLKYEISKVTNTIKEDESVLDDSGKKIKNMKKLAEKVKSEILAKKEKGRQLVEESSVHKQNILKLQEEIISKVAKNKERISKEIIEGKSSTEKFRQFFNNKVKIERLIKDLENQRDGLEQDLIGLIKKAKAFHLTSRSSGLKGNVKDLEETYGNILKKKAKFEKEIQDLGSLVKS